MSDELQFNTTDAPEEVTTESTSTATVDERLARLEDFATVVARGTGREVEQVLEHARENGVLEDSRE